MTKWTARDLTACSMCVALLTVCSWISVPLVIPFTLQTFAVCLAGALFSIRVSLGAVAGYILLGAAGVPVFSGFRGGPSALLGPTGGYILGFLFTVLAVSLAVRRFGRKLPVLLLSMAAGVVLCYVFGTLWFVFVYSRSVNPVGIGTALGWCVLPYLVPDGIKIALAAALTLRLRPLAARFSVSSGLRGRNDPC